MCKVSLLQISLFFAFLSLIVSGCGSAPRPSEPKAVVHFIILFSVDHDALNRSLPRDPARTLRGLASMAGRGQDRHCLRRQPHHANLAGVVLLPRLGGGLKIDGRSLLVLREALTQSACSRSPSSSWTGVPGRHRG